MAVTPPDIRAAGTVLLRPGGSGDLEVALIHRSRRRDWSLPKGKVDPGEHVAAAAVRETWEETGMHVVLGAPLPTSTYDVAGRRKTVRYWRATVTSGHFAPNREVDELTWVPVHEAGAVLTYPHDVEVVRAAAASHADAPITSPLLVVRHASATRRVDWQASGEPDAHDDRHRPLTADGGVHAAALGDVLAAYGVDVLMSSDARRCRETLAPYAVRAGSALLHEPLLSEEGHSASPGATAARVAEIVVSPGAIVLCTHRPVMPDIVRVLAAELDWDPTDRALDPALSPGGMIVVHRDASAVARGRGRAVALERHHG